MKEYEPEDLLDFIEVEAIIECSNCKAIDDNYGDTGEDEFFYKGWRATRDNVYCPTCAPIKLKLPKPTKKATVGK